jgi:copper resistance protein C
MFKKAISVLMLGSALVGTCLAHAKLVSSSPASDAKLTEAPQTLSLKFNEAAQLAMLKLVSAGKEIAIPLDKGAKAGKDFTLTLPKLAAGQYVVQWSAVAADDGHVTKGSFSFSIAG